MSIRPEIVLRNHPSHPWHGLELKNYMKPYTCNGCKEKGFGPRYRCERCDFNLHQACSYTSLRLSSHDYFPGSKFKFLRNPPKPCHPECIIRCDACRKTVKGYVFHCEEDDIDLHPCCRNLKRSYQIEEVKFKLHRKVRGKCMWCNRKNLKDGGNNDNGWSYVSECDNYHVHVACVTEMALEEWYNYNNHNNRRSGGGSSSSSSSSSGSLRVMKSTTTAPQSLSVKLKVQEIQARGRWDGGAKNKFWRITKFIIKTVVSIVIGDPTMIIASFFVELLP